MTDKNQTNNAEFLDIIVWEERKKGGQKKHIPHKLGYGVTLENGNIACHLLEGISIHGSFTVAMQKKDE